MYTFALLDQNIFLAICGTIEVNIVTEKLDINVLCSCDVMAVVNLKCERIVRHLDLQQSCEWLRPNREQSEPIHHITSARSGVKNDE
ncbi:hypothetical protein CW697_11035 [Macrococcoides caseolyticum]|nr:hypothetical protein CW718_11060 [Macrococcus caseolyticus]PKE73550.1 hypothetical protein CW670_11520 [Macrococcus caseolyticus]PKF28867.1 hypothetical protein CW697_11035 [Macrococcus caseolyticus]